MEKMIVSVKESVFGKGTENERVMYQLYIIADDGAVGSLYSTEKYVIGDVVTLGIGVNKDGRLVARIVHD